MQKQQRNTNNPANPRIKVAALDIRRAYERVTKQASCYASIKLNFKKSRDIRGITHDKSGQEITVNFTLAIRKATLQVKFQFEDSRDNGHVTISKVAFMEGLTASRSIHDIQEYNLSAEGLAKGEASFGTGLSNTIGSLTASVSAKGSKKHEKKILTNQKTATQYKITGISATQARNIIDWSIDSSWTRKEEIDYNGNTYLSGEVFKDASTEKQIYACRVAWNYIEASSAMEIHGSVRAMMQDLIIEDIVFIDKYGSEQKWSAIRTLDNEASESGLRDHLGLNKEEFKRRLVRQIIKKHLVSQGMVAEGASIEICSARG